MSGTGYQENLGYRYMYEREAFHCLGRIHLLPAKEPQLLLADQKVDSTEGPRIVLQSTAGAGTVALTSLPHITPPADGSSNMLYLEGGHATDLITLSSEAALPGSGLKLDGGGTITLGYGHTLTLYYSEAHSAYLELSRSVNS